MENLINDTIGTDGIINDKNDMVEGETIAQEFDTEVNAITLESVMNTISEMQKMLNTLQTDYSGITSDIGLLRDDYNKVFANTGPDVDIEASTKEELGIKKIIEEW